jgi:hypothetical protein
VRYILILFVLFLGFVCKHFIAKERHEHEKDDKELMIQDAKGKKEKCRKRLIFTSLLYGCIFA